MRRAWVPRYFPGHEVGGLARNTSHNSRSLPTSTHSSFPFLPPAQWIFPTGDSFLGEGAGLCPFLPNDLWK